MHSTLLVWEYRCKLLVSLTSFRFKLQMVNYLVDMVRNSKWSMVSLRSRAGYLEIILMTFTFLPTTTGEEMDVSRARRRLE